MSWTTDDVRVRRPWITAAAALAVLLLLVPTGGWVGCAAGAGTCVERTQTLVGVDLPASWHPAVWVLAVVVAGVLAWTVTTHLTRRRTRGR